MPLDSRCSRMASLRRTRLPTLLFIYRKLQTSLSVRETFKSWPMDPL
jgi:hypothetical protein